MVSLIPVVRFVVGATHASPLPWFRSSLGRRMRRPCPGFVRRWGDACVAPALVPFVVGATHASPLSLFLRLAHDFFGCGLRDFLVMTELHRINRATLRHRAKLG